VRERSFIEARRASSQDTTRASDRIAIASALFGAVVVALMLIGRELILVPHVPAVSSLVDPNGGQVRRVQSGYMPSAAQPAATEAPPQPTAAPRQPTPPAGTEPGSRRQVANTDGQGVVLPASPRDDDKTPRGFMDGDWVTRMAPTGSRCAATTGSKDGFRRAT